LAPQVIDVAVSDASILINLAHTNHLRLLGSLPRYRFVAPDEVIAEVLTPRAKEKLLEALQRGWLVAVSISTPAELETFADLSRVLGMGESACLALAQARGWLVACDERRAFLREAWARLGEGRVLNTAGIYVLAIRAGLLSIEDADAAKGLLEQRRFRLKFRSFRDIL
jgi:predicted nucleic acid-binding protein